MELSGKARQFRRKILTEAEVRSFVAITLEGRRFAVPLDQLQCECRDKKTKQAVEDWHYWMAQGYQFG